jgi:hypothetical protein
MSGLQVGGGSMEAMGMAIETLISEFRQQLHGRLTDRQRVIDQLLDLRLVSEGRPEFRSAVDALLGSVPGLTVVETDWWRLELDRLAAVYDAAPVA